MSDKLEALKAKKPADTKSLKSQAAGYVTDDNSGGYYVVECHECGEIYPSQECDGGGQIADSGDYNDALCPHCGYVDPDECDNVGLVWNVQQAKINALLAALEEANKRTEAESVGADKSAVNAVEWMKRANAAEQREDHLKADVAVMGKRIAELEREKTNIAMLCADTCAKAKQKHDELERRLQQPIPESLIDSVCHTAAEIFRARYEDKAQEIIDNIREMLTSAKGV